MKKKSLDDDIARLAAGDIDSSMILMLANDGERIYLHQFETDIGALEFLELMVASFRADVLDRISRRSMN
jgi:hypothetical protein